MNVKERMKWPSGAHICGTDELGRDIFTRIIYGAQYSLAVGLVAVLIALIVGVLLGSAAGYIGGVFENVVMRICDIFSSIPSVLMAIAVVSALGKSTINLMIAVGIASTAPFVRVARAAVLVVRDEEYVEAARAIGQPDWKIVMPVGVIVNVCCVFLGSLIGTIAGKSISKGLKEHLPVVFGYCAMEKIAAECPNVIGVKYSFADMRRIIEYTKVRGGNFSVVPGADDWFLPALSVGCDGVVSGCSGPFPEAFVAVYDAYKKGDMELARKAQKHACRGRYGFELRTGGFGSECWCRFHRYPWVQPRSGEALPRSGIACDAGVHDTIGD